MKTWSPFKLLLFGCASCLIFSFLFITQARAATFDPNMIISDAEMLDWTSLNLADIEAFLASHGSYLANRQFPNANGEYRMASRIIYDAATDNYDCADVDIPDDATIAEKRVRCPAARINPKLLLVLLQKEQSLIDDQTPKQSQLDWATGYGCPDGGGCNSRWKGFGKQVNSAAIQFYDYMKYPHHYSFRKGNTYTISNTGRPSSVVTIGNDATAALYNYTPHVYNGNYNFWKLWLRYFTLSYGNNTLLQAKGEDGVWLVQNSVRRPFLTKGALTSRFDLNKIVMVNRSDLERYPIGAPIKFPQYSLLRSPRGTVFLLVDDKRRGFVSAEALRQIGINPEEIINASWEDINIYSEGKPITEDDAYPTGALFQDKTTGGIYFVTEGTKAPLWDAVLLKTKFKGKAIIPESPEKLASYQTVEPAIFGDGELLKSLSSPAVYVIDSGRRRAFTSGIIFEQLGYKWENIIIVPDKIIKLYLEGQAVSEIYAAESELELKDQETSTSTEETITTSTPDEELQEEIEDILNP